MRKVALSSLIALIIITVSSTWGLAADQQVNVIIPSRAFIWIMTPNITINIPSIDTWPAGAETITRPSQNFNIITALNTLGNSDMVVSATALQSGANGPTIPLSDLRINLDTFLSGASTSGTLDQTVVLRRIGTGIRLTSGRYDLTVSAAQQAGTYTGTVTFTLVNN